MENQARLNYIKVANAYLQGRLEAVLKNGQAVRESLDHRPSADDPEGSSLLEEGLRRNRELDILVKTIDMFKTFGPTHMIRHGAEAVLKITSSNLQGLANSQERYIFYGSTDKKSLKNRSASFTPARLPSSIPTLISFNCPLGKSIIGKKAGDIVTYSLNGRKNKVEIISIE